MRPKRPWPQGRNEVKWRPGQEAGLAPPCYNLKSFANKSTVLKKVLVTLLALFGDPAVIWCPVAILRGGLGGPWPLQIFAWPPVFFLISRISSFGWHMHGCQMRFVKIPVILSTAPDLSCVVIRKQHSETETISIVKPQLIICPILADSLHFGGCVTWQSQQGLRQLQQINFAEETVLTRFTTRVIMIWEILR